MKIKLSIRRVFQILFCLMALVGAIGTLSLVFSVSMYSSIASIVIILVNIAIIAIDILCLGNGFHKLLFCLDFFAFAALVYFSPTLFENAENKFTLLLISGGIFAYFTYIGIKQFLLLLLIPFKIIGFIDRFANKKEKKGFLSGTKWVCTNSYQSAIGIVRCKQTTVTFRKGVSAPSSLKDCMCSEDGRHNFVQIGAGNDIDSSVRHVIEWIGLIIGFLIAAGCFALKFING